MRHTTTLPAFVLVDAHVHFHACFELAAFLDAAAANFRRGAEQLRLPGHFTGCLLLAESAGEHWFQQWKDGSEAAGGWTFEATAEDCSLAAGNSSGDRFFLIAGRQIATREGVEVLALGCDAEISEGLPLDEALTHVRACGALPVLPWGFAKWWLRRGTLVSAAFRSRNGTELFLGDNAGRPALAGRPSLFREAWDQGVPVLPGSDPLPFPEHADRAGSYGCVLAGPLDEERPAEFVLGALRRIKGQPRIYGCCSDLSGFVRDQVTVQWRRRSGELVSKEEAAT
jgi:hypothetical protein